MSHILNILKSYGYFRLLINYGYFSNLNKYENKISFLKS